MKLSNTQILTVKKIFKTLELGEIKDIKIENSVQNIVYKVVTTNKTYILKEYSKDAVKNEYDLNKRKRQISISERFSQNGIPTILPLTFNNRNFIKYKSKHYLIYDYVDYKVISPSDLTPKKVKKLSSILAIIHKLNIKSDLPSQYKTIKIDLNKHLKKFKKINDKLYKTLYDNYFSLENLIDDCNSSIKYIQNHLCVSHNDYNLKNILWDNDYMYLIDFDACCMVNPAASLAECAFNISLNNNKINYETYKDFIKTYIKKYGTITTYYKDALNTAMNGKLQWLEYTMSKCTKTNSKMIEETINLIKELSLYKRQIEDLNELYLSVVKN